MGEGAEFVFTPNEAAWLAMTRSPNGAVARDLRRRAAQVETAARQQIPMGRVFGGAHPRLIADRPLRDTGKTQIAYTSWSEPVAFVGFYARIALIHHEGTKPHTIVPRHAKVLAFWSNKSGGMVFTKIVHHPGTRGNHYLTENLHLALE